MMVRKSKDHMSFNSWSPAKITQMGNIADLLVYDNKIKEPSCIKLSKDCYLNTETGEVKDYKHISNRSECYDSIRKTMRKIRALINANAVHARYIRWITLTYRENMTDRERLYSDFDKFWKRFLYYLKKEKLSKPEYISVVEPQGRGAWHIHAIFIWKENAPFIANEILARVWRHGYVSIKQPKNCDNLGAYFTAYLANMPAEDVDALDDNEKSRVLAAASLAGNVEPTEVVDNVGQKKKVIKGSRLGMYPPGMNIYRHSRGVKQPEIMRTTYGYASKLLAESTETFRQSFEIVDELGRRKNRILKASYNSKRK